MSQFNDTSTTCGPRSLVRQLLASACLVTVFLFVAYEWPAAPPTRPVNRILAASSNSSEPYTLSNLSGKQSGNFGGGSGGNFEGGIGIVIGSCTHATEVSNIRACNEGSIQVRPQIYQAWKWNMFGTWLAPNTCLQFDNSQYDPHAREPMWIRFAYLRPGDGWWIGATGHFSYKRNSPCVGVLRCAGNPLVCSQGPAVTAQSLTGEGQITAELWVRSSSNVRGAMQPLSANDPFATSNLSRSMP